MVTVLFLFLTFGWLCPFQTLTGLPCPGCNMTTALYWLARGDLSLSFWYHPMAIPTIVTALLWLIFRKRREVAGRILTVWGIMMLVCYAWRMLTVFPAAPMQPGSGLISHLFNGSKL